MDPVCSCPAVPLSPATRLGPGGRKLSSGSLSGVLDDAQMAAGRAVVFPACRGIAEKMCYKRAEQLLEAESLWPTPPAVSIPPPMVPHLPPPSLHKSPPSGGAAAALCLPTRAWSHFPAWQSAGAKRLSVGCSSRSKSVEEPPGTGCSSEWEQGRRRVLVLSRSSSVRHLAIPGLRGSGMRWEVTSEGCQVPCGKDHGFVVGSLVLILGHLS